MARINIEDSLFRDLRFSNLSFKTGSRTMALGAIVEAFILAQSHFFDKETGGLIPEKLFMLIPFASEILETGLAEKRPLGVYVSGSESAFNWLDQKKEAGRRGGLKRAENAKRNAENESSGRLASASGRLADPSESKPLTLTPALTLTQNTLNTNSTTAELEKPVTAEAAETGSLPAQRSQSFPVKVETVEELIGHLPAETLNRWAELYPDKEFLQRELKKAFGYYCHDNPKKKPASRRGWAQALSSWLDRGWSKQARFTKGTGTPGWDEQRYNENQKRYEENKNRG